MANSAFLGAMSRPLHERLIMAEITRRGLAKVIATGAIGAGVLSTTGGRALAAQAEPALAAQAGHAPAAAGHARTAMSANQALATLKQGNANFITDRPMPQPIGHKRRLEIARGQTPFAILVSCSDSRVAPELLFGRGLGELFIVRNAGNTVDAVAQGSVEYAVAELGVPLIVVLGHERCGAVGAAKAVVENNARFPGTIGRVVEPIIPAVLDVRGKPGDPFENAVRQNVRRIVAHLRAEIDQPVLGAALRGRSLRVVGAYYDLDTGTVDFFDEA